LPVSRTQSKAKSKESGLGEDFNSDAGEFGVWGLASDLDP
jgi:hypothetical protein